VADVFGGFGHAVCHHVEARSRRTPRARHRLVEIERVEAGQQRPAFLARPVEESEQFIVRRRVVVQPARPLIERQARRVAARPVRDQPLPERDVPDDRCQGVRGRVARLSVQTVLGHRSHHLPVPLAQAIERRLRVLDQRLHRHLPIVTPPSPARTLSTNRG
jgi:hypothetical protein